MKKKMIASVLAAVMAVSTVPGTAFAATEAQTDAPAAVQAETTEDVTPAKVDELIGAIGTVTYTKETEALIKAARDAYDSLSGYDQTKVTKLDVLEQAETAYKALKDEVDAAETALAAIEEQVVLADLEADGAVVKAMDAYGKLSADDGTLAALSETAKAKAALYTAENIAAVKDVITDIAAVKPSKITRDNYTDPEAMAAVTEAEESYNALSSDALRNVIGNVANLKIVREKIATFQKEVIEADEFLEKLKKEIGTGEGQVSLDQAVFDYMDALVAYNWLSDAQEKELKDQNAKDTLEARHKEIYRLSTEAKNQAAADAVIDLLKKLPTANAVTTDSEEQIRQAREAWLKLTPEQMDLVPQSVLGELIRAEEAFNKVISELSAEQKTQRVLDAIAKISDENQSTYLRTALDAMAEYNRGTAQVNMKGEITGTPDPWQAAVTPSELTKLQAALYKANEAENLAATALKNIKTAYAALAPLADKEISNEADLKAANDALKAADDAYNNSPDRAKELFEADKDTVTAKENYDKVTSAVETYHKKNKYAAVAKELAEQMAVLKGDKATLADKEETDKVTAAYKEARVYVREYFSASGPYADVFVHYQKTVAAITAAEAASQAPEVEKLIKALPIIDAETADQEEIDSVIATCKEVEAALKAIDQDHRGLVRNVAKIDQVNAAINAAIKTLTEKEINKIGPLFTTLTEEQKEVINTVTALNKKYDISQNTARMPEAAAWKLYTDAKSKLDKENADLYRSEADVVELLIKLIPDNIDDITKVHAATVICAKGEYEKLSDEARVLVDEEAVKKLSKAISAIDFLKLKFGTTIEKIEPQIYTGSVIEPAVELRDLDGKVIPEDQYDVFYKDNINAGQATITVVAKADSEYFGTKSIKFTIEEADLQNAYVTGVVNREYRGVGRTQNPTVKVGKTTLVKNADYKLTFANNVEIGKNATVTITGIGNYTGKITKRYSIVPQQAKITVTAGYKSMKVAVTPQKGKVRYQYAYRVKGAKSFKTVYSSKTSLKFIRLQRGKTYEVKVRAYKGSGSAFTAGAYSKVKSIKVR